MQLKLLANENETKTFETKSYKWTDLMTLPWFLKSFSSVSSLLIRLISPAKPSSMQKQLFNGYRIYVNSQGKIYHKFVNYYVLTSFNGQLIHVVGEERMW